jgi:glycosyltransferase 2 family protein
MNRMKRWQFWVGILISIVFLYLALGGLELETVWTVVQSANYFWLLPGIAVYFVGVWVRAWRWKALLRPLKSISTGAMFPVSYHRLYGQ